MPGSWSPADFPGLDPASFAITSQHTRTYNCIAWAAGESKRRWEPDPLGIYHWPAGVQREYSIESFIKAYETLGYRVCFGSELEGGIEKVAIFSIAESGIQRPTHAALQLESGKWTSKLGDLEDIEHDPLQSVNGPLYGTPTVYMSRVRPKA